MIKNIVMGLQKQKRKADENLAVQSTTFAEKYAGGPLNILVVIESHSDSTTGEVVFAERSGGHQEVMPVSEVNQSFRRTAT